VERDKKLGNVYLLGETADCASAKAILPLMEWLRSWLSSFHSFGKFHPLRFKMATDNGDRTGSRQRTRWDSHHIQGQKCVMPVRADGERRRSPPGCFSEASGGPLTKEGSVIVIGVYRRWNGRWFPVDRRSAREHSSALRERDDMQPATARG
jgi:hypothetical protein